MHIVIELYLFALFVFRNVYMYGYMHISKHVFCVFFFVVVCVCELVCVSLYAIKFFV